MQILPCKCNTFASTKFAYYVPLNKTLSHSAYDWPKIDGLKLLLKPS